MSRQILFVQGGGDGTHDAWDNKLVDSLTAELGEGYELRYPPMPNEGEPDYATWKAALVKEFADLGDDAILVGHSIGGTFLIHTVAEQHPKRRWSAIALIAAPYLGDGGWSGDATDPAANLAEALRPDVPVFLYHGAADGEVPPAHMTLYARAIPHATSRLLDGLDHQLGNDLSAIARDIRNGFPPLI